MNSALAFIAVQLVLPLFVFYFCFCFIAGRKNSQVLSKDDRFSFFIFVLFEPSNVLFRIFVRRHACLLVTLEGTVPHMRL